MAAASCAETSSVGFVMAELFGERGGTLAPTLAVARLPCEFLWEAPVTVPRIAAIPRAAANLTAAIRNLLELPEILAAH